MHQFRRYLVINFRVGTAENGHFVGPVLVSTSDYCSFHFWDEPDAAALDEGDYQVLRVYPLGCGLTEALRRYAGEFGTVRPAGELALTLERETPTFFLNLGRPLPVATA